MTRIWHLPAAGEMGF